MTIGLIFTAAITLYCGAMRCGAQNPPDLPTFYVTEEMLDSVAAGNLPGPEPDGGSAGNIIDAREDSIAQSKTTDLGELIVKAGKQKYSRKNNPAYELMKRIRSSKKVGDPLSLPDFTQDFYQKIQLGLYNNDGSKFSGKERLTFLKEYVDTMPESDVPVLLVSLREIFGKHLHRLDPKSEKYVIEGERAEGIDQNFNQENISAVLQDILRPIDIYNDDITLMQQRFVSPIGRLADSYYRYYITDTIHDGDKRYIELSFAPRTPESFSFNGRMTVEDNDSSFFIKEVRMRVPRVINLNYIDNIFVHQKYEKDEFGKRHLTLDDMWLELTLIKGTQSLYARRQKIQRLPASGIESRLTSIFNKLQTHVTLSDANEQPWDKWDKFRPIPLSSAEKGMGSFMNRLRRYPLVYWGEKTIKLLVDGYVTTGKNSKFDFGPINTFLSFNSIEGVRLRVGGMTTAKLSDRWFARGYVAYGTKDRKFKYNAELEYSLVPKKNHAREFPVNSVRLNYMYDLDMIGQHYLFTNPDNIFLSLKRKKDNLALYKRESGAAYTLELANNFSLMASARHIIMYSTPLLPFVDGEGHSFSSYNRSGLKLILRYAPGEKFYQGKTYRLPINMDAPIFQLTQEYAPGNVLGNKFTINRTELSVAKRVWFSSFGYADCILKGGYTWSKVPYPELMWQNANLSYTIQPESYSLMNPMEYAMDYFGSLDVTYFMNGLIFNRIPLIKKLKLREVITFKGLMGGLTDKNNPAIDPGLFAFPQDAEIGRLTAKPYMELGAGIDNILTCLRIDYIWRLTYRNAPGGAPNSGLRVSLHFSF